MFEAIVPVIFATNNGYAPYVSVAINSLIKNSSEKCFYNIHVLHSELSEKNRNMLESMNGDNFSVSCLCVDRFIERETKYMYTNFHFSREMFYRILIPSIFTEYERAIYLDSDIVVLGDISELFFTRIDGNVIGGCCDIMHGKSRSYVLGELKLDPEKYINSGVLLIDCEAYRRESIKEKCFELLSKKSKLRYPDQDILNLACEGKIKFLDRKWNYIWHYHFKRNDPSLNLPVSKMEKYVEDADEISVLHFTSAIKPWKNKNSPLSVHFWSYVPNTPFEDKITSDFLAIKNRNYATYHFMRQVSGRIRFTVSLQTLEGLTTDDLLVYSSGKPCEISRENSEMIEISEKLYVRTFFSFSVDVNNMPEAIRIVIYNKRTGIPLTIASARTFDVCFTTQSTAYRDGLAIYKERSALVVASASKNLILAREKTHKLNLKTKRKDKTYLKSLVLRCAFKLLKPFVRKDVWLISDRKERAGDNGEAFYRYLVSNAPKGILPVFVIDRSSPDYKKLKKLGRVIAPMSKKHKLYSLFATRNISSQMEKTVMEPIHCAEYLKDILAKRKVVFLQHGITKDDISFAYNRPKDNISLFITAAKKEYLSIINNIAYHCDENIVKLTGFARYDRLFDNQEKIIFIAPTWRRSCLSDVALREPINDFTDTAYYKFYSSILSSDKLIAAARELGYRICFYQHYMMEKTDPIFDLTDPIFIPREEILGYSDIFSRGALMLTDYSSTQFDFAYLKKPIIYAHFDKDEFFGSHTYTEGYFSYQEDGFGDICESVSATVDKIIDTIRHGTYMSEKYKKRVDEFFAFSDRNNCERIYEEVKNLK